MEAPPHAPAGQSFRRRSRALGAGETRSSGIHSLSQRLRQLVASLPEKPRMIMILRYQEDLNPEEIAELLTIPLGTVKSQLQRSLAILREKVTRAIGEVAI